MTNNTNIAKSETLTYEDLNTEFLTLRIGEEIQKLEIVKIRKVSNMTKADNLPGVDYKYFIESKDGKILTINSWILWKTISNALRDAGKLNATLYLRHNDIEDYTVKIL